MYYSPIVIACYFVQLAEIEKTPISPMKIQKLVYFAHCWHLALEGKPLISDQVEAWEFGPVIPTLYHFLIGLGEKPIPKRWINDNLVCFEQIHKTSVSKLLEKVWEVYGGYSGVRLANATHVKSDPWYKTWHKEGKYRKNTNIPDDLIKKIYKAKIKARK